MISENWENDSVGLSSIDKSSQGDKMELNRVYVP